MPEKAPKISTHAPRHNKPAEKQPSFIHKNGEQTFFGATHSHAAITPTAFIQPKLQMSKPGDPFEQEADQQADKVMRMSEPSPVMASSPAAPPPEENIQRKEEEEIQPKMYVDGGGTLVQRMEEESVQSKENDDEEVQRKEDDDEQVQPSVFRKPTNVQLQQQDEDIQPKTSYLARKDRGPPAVSTRFENNLHSNTGSGKSMDNHTQQFMESRFNADFSGVKVHTGAHASAMSSSINAQAFTHGNNIYFNAGKYNPDTGGGKHLLAHELTHTIQQGAAKSVQPFLSTNKASFGGRQSSLSNNSLSAQRKNTSPNVSLNPVSILPKKEIRGLQRGTPLGDRGQMVQAKGDPTATNQSSSVRPELKRAVAFAQSQVGKVDANKKNADGTRHGWQQLVEYFQTAMGPDKVVPDGGIQKPGSIMEKNIREKGKPIKAQKPNQSDPKVQVERDAMPSWCGIFVFWSLNKGGIPMPKWTIGGNAVSLKAAYPKSHIPKPGDIAYFDTNSHYAIVEKTEPENPETKDIKKIKVSTVNGNTTGENNLGGQVQVKSHPVSHWAGFFNPLFGLEDKLPKDPKDVTEAEIQQILNKAAAATTANTTSNPAAVTPYEPKAASPPANAPPVPVAGEKAAAEETVAEGEAAPAGGEKVDAPVEAPSPKSPAEDPAFQEVIKKSGYAKSTQKKHGVAGEKSAAAQLASEVPKDLDVNSQAQYHQVGAMNVQKAGTFSKEAFKAQLMERVKKALPKNDKETLDMYEDSSDIHKRMDEAKANAKDDVKAEKDKAGNAIATTANAPPNPSFAKPKVTKGMDAEDAGKKPYIPKAETAAPKPKTDAEISMEKDAQGLDDEMANSNVTEDQLAKSNEPKFTGALDEKKEAQTQARNAPAEYRDQENPMLAKAKGKAENTVQGNMADMNNARGGLFGKVDTSKTNTKSKDELKRKEIADNLQRIYGETKTKVETRLNTLEKNVIILFDSAAITANAVFESSVSSRLSDFYGITTVDDTISEWVSGIDPEINQIFTEERDRYIATMDTSINNIATIVEAELNAAMKDIATGKENIDTYWNGLDPATQKIGEDAKKEIEDQFGELERSVQEKHDSLVEQLGDRYVKNLEQLQETFDKIKASKQGWLSGALNAIKAVIETIIKLKDMLFETLSRIAQVIGDIISDPIGFLGNMVEAVGLGLHNFKENIATHLKKGFFEWLLGNMPPGIVFPDKWDLTGIFQFIMQILGLTWSNIRMRAVKKLGEPVVSALEEVFEIFQIIRKEGLAGLWRYIKEKVGDLKVMVLDAIENFLIEKVIKAGIMWVVGLLNPVGAFIKACQAIYKIVMFFIDNGKKIMEFVNAVIDSIANIVAGNISGAAKMVEDALARIIPLAIGFLASLLGLDGISEKVQKIIKAIQAPINRAIDWVLDKAIALAKKLGIDKVIRKVKGGVDGAKKWAKNKVEQGKEKIKEIKDSVVNWWKAKKPVTYLGKQHTMCFEGEGDNAKLIMRSAPVTYEAFIKDIPCTPAEKTVLKNKAKAIDAKLKGYGRVKQEDRKVWADELVRMMNELADLTEKHAMAEVADPHTVINWGPTTSEGFGTYFHAKLLSRKYVSGEEAAKESKAVYGWDIARGRKMIAESGIASPVYVKGHLLNENVGGKANATNLTPITSVANGDHKSRVEFHVKKIVLGKGDVTDTDTGHAVANYEVEAAYTKHPNRTGLKQNYYDRIAELREEQKRQRQRNDGNSAGAIANIERAIEGNNNMVLLLDYEEHYLPTSFVCRWQKITHQGTKGWALAPGESEHLVEVPTPLPGDVEVYKPIVNQMDSFK